MVDAPVKETKMVAKPESKTKMVKMRALHDLQVSDKIMEPGSVFEVQESEAVDLERAVPGPYNFIGEHSAEFAEKTRTQIRRAVRL